ncbi:MAG: response regulator transcription factor [Dehalococcoidales bacterium]|nr:response regulator transcription factor [Dehalococcoidales bacterium]
MEKIKVLIADDHLLAQQGLRRILEREADIECVAAAKNGERAVELVRKHLPDVALIDVAMPVMNGIEATKAIKTSCPNTAVIILSAYDYDHYVRACVEAGASGYLLKSDLLPRRLVNAIRTVYSGTNVFDRKAGEIMRRMAISKGKKGPDSEELRSRELQILKLVIKGMSNKEIASELHISEQTVGTHLANIFKKLGVQSRVEAMLYALKKGWDSLNEPGYE